MRSLKHYIRILVLLCMGLFPYSSPVIAENALPAFLSTCGHETDLYYVRDSYKNPQGTTGLIIIEDAHCNPPIQKKIIALLNHFIARFKEENISSSPLVLQEGGTNGPIDTSILKKDKSPEELTQYLNKKLNAGEVGAAEFMHTQKGGFTFYGIENPALYEKNYTHFMAIARRRTAIDGLLADMEKKLTSIKEIAFTDELRTFYNSIHQDYDLSRLDEYLQSLRILTLQYEIPMDTYPTFRDLFETIDALEDIPYEKAQEELSLLNTTHGLTKKLTDYKELLEGGLLTLHEYPILYKFAKLHDHLASVDMLSFLEEKESLENTLLSAIAYTDEEKELVDVLQNFAILKNVLSLTLQYGEYDYYIHKMTDQEHLFSSILDYITSYYVQFKPELPLDEIELSAKNFYGTVTLRDDALTNNIVTALNNTEETLGILIIGGFHTKGITDRLRKKGISFIVITPKLTEDITPSLDTYYTVMERFWKAKE